MTAVGELLRRRYFLNGSSEVGGLLAELAAVSMAAYAQA
jgi:hypothetical protein